MSRSPVCSLGEHRAKAVALAHTYARVLRRIFKEQSLITVSGVPSVIEYFHRIKFLYSRSISIINPHFFGLILANLGSVVSKW